MTKNKNNKVRTAPIPERPNSSSTPQADVKPTGQKVAPQKTRVSESVIVNFIYFGIQALSVVLWFALWWIFLGFVKLQLGFRWYIPLLCFTAMESLGVAIEAFKVTSNGDRVEIEMALIKQIEDNVGKVIPPIAILAAIPTFLLNKGVPLPTEFYSLIFIAVVTILGGALSWFGDVKSSSSQLAIMAIRQVKGECYRHSLAWVLAALIALYDWLAMNTYVKP